MSSEVEKIDAKSLKIKVKSAKGSETMELKNDFVFVFAGGDPPYPLLQSMGIKFGGDSSQKKELVDKTVKNAA